MCVLCFLCKNDITSIHVAVVCRKIANFLLLLLFLPHDAAAAADDDDDDDDDAVSNDRGAWTVISNHVMRDSLTQRDQSYTGHRRLAGLHQALLRSARPRGRDEAEMRPRRRVQ